MQARVLPLSIQIKRWTVWHTKTISKAHRTLLDQGQLDAPTQQLALQRSADCSIHEQGMCIAMSHVRMPMPICMSNILHHPAIESLMYPPLVQATGKAIID